MGQEVEEQQQQQQPLLQRLFHVSSQIISWHWDMAMSAFSEKSYVMSIWSKLLQVSDERKLNLEILSTFSQGKIRTIKQNSHIQVILILVKLKPMRRSNVVMEHSVSGMFTINDNHSSDLFFIERAIQIIQPNILINSPTGHCLFQRQFFFATSLLTAFAPLFYSW